ncbi:MAG: UvrD-helicase domain-containing protein [Treponema sp.]|jgi:uncharacterized protein (TIGR00375 family)|nr:UvrD-helicase domain-containing protein [Treponema sp.]
MKIIGDLHIHSHFSRATSKKLTPFYLDRWARIKGIDLIGSGDCTHPAWLAELREQLDETEEGLFTLKKEIRAGFDANPANAGIPAPGTNTVPRFVLTGEISTIYKKDNKTRKVHHLVILPGFKAAAVFQAKLERIGNIRSDGRPILGINSRELLSLLIEADERSLLIPAHIWTPWFSVLGAKSGFDAIDECYGDLSALIPAIETGLSSNPPMNWALSSLDRFSVISNSDAHSPEKLGREATVFEMELSFNSLAGALRLKQDTPLNRSPAGVNHEGILYTVEFYPQEGKYHYDGHRKCGVNINPEEASDGLCPVCGKSLTMGVMRRVLELADRPVDEWAACPSDNEGTNRRHYASLIPLRELAGELLNTGDSSKKVDAAYNELIKQGGSELSLLIDTPPGDIEKMNVPGIPGEHLAEAISRMRNGQVFIQAGYDGEYGVIRVFPEGTKRQESPEQPLFFFNTDIKPSPETASSQEAAPLQEAAPSPRPVPQLKPAPEARQGRNAKTKQQNYRHAQSGGNAPLTELAAVFLPDTEQEKAIGYDGPSALIIAGPGAGKTATLTARITRLVRNGTDPASILAISFTVKAAQELRDRIGRSAAEAAEKASPAGKGPAENGITAATFHSFCAAILREQNGARNSTKTGGSVPENAGNAPYSPDFKILNDTEREALLKEICSEKSGKIRFRALGNYIEGRKRFLLLPGEAKPDLGKENTALSLLAEILGLPEFDPEKDALYRVYQEKLRYYAKNAEDTPSTAMDFDDLVANTVGLLSQSPEIREQYQNRCRFIFVDEYQDINFAQYALIRLLAHGRTGQRLWAIGDPNQAIYAFRGSDKRFIDRFLTDYPEAARFYLKRSFRCAAPIITAAGALVNASLSGREAEVSLFRTEYPGEKAEAEGIARRISGLVGGTSFFAFDSGSVESLSGAGDVSLDAIAILLRAASLAPPIVKALADHGIPCRLPSEKPWWEEEPAASLLSILQDSQNGNVFNIKGLSPKDAIIRAWKLQGKKESPLIERLIATASFYNDTDDFLDTLAVSRGEDGGELKKEGVRIMTIHGSKGLEFAHVFVPALEDGILPFTLYNENAEAVKVRDSIEEEQRLLYVAMTRAKTGLYLSWARKRLFQGRLLEKPPSRFLEKLETLIPLAEPRKRSQKPKDRDTQPELF